MHFLAQGVEVVPALRMQKAHFVRRLLYGNLIANHEAGQRLHVKVGAGIAARHNFNADFAGVWQHNGPIGKGVRRNGRNDQAT